MSNEGRLHAEFVEGVERYGRHKDVIIRIDELLTSLWQYFYEELAKKDQSLVLEKVNRGFASEQIRELFRHSGTELPNDVKLRHSDRIEGLVIDSSSISKFINGKTKNPDDSNKDLYSVFLGYAGWSDFTKGKAAIGLSKTFLLDGRDSDVARLIDEHLKQIGKIGGRDWSKLKEPSFTYEESGDFSDDQCLLERSLNQGQKRHSFLLEKEFSTDFREMLSGILDKIAGDSSMLSSLIDQHLELLDAHTEKWEVWLDSFFTSILSEGRITDLQQIELEQFATEHPKQGKFVVDGTVRCLSISLGRVSGIDRLRQLAKLIKLIDDQMSQATMIISVSFVILREKPEYWQDNQIKDVFRDFEAIPTFGLRLHESIVMLSEKVLNYPLIVDQVQEQFGKSPLSWNLAFGSEICKKEPRLNEERHSSVIQGWRNPSLTPNQLLMVSGSLKNLSDLQLKLLGGAFENEFNQYKTLGWINPFDVRILYCERAAELILISLQSVPKSDETRNSLLEFISGFKTPEECAQEVTQHFYLSSEASFFSDETGDAGSSELERYNRLKSLYRLNRRNSKEGKCLITNDQVKLILASEIPTASYEVALELARLVDSSKLRQNTSLESKKLIQELDNLVKRGLVQFSTPYNLCLELIKLYQVIGSERLISIAIDCQELIHDKTRYNYVAGYLCYLIAERHDNFDALEGAEWYVQQLDKPFHDKPLHRILAFRCDFLKTVLTQGVSQVSWAEEGDNGFHDQVTRDLDAALQYGFMLLSQKSWIPSWDILKFVRENTLTKKGCLIASLGMLLAAYRANNISALKSMSELIRREFAKHVRVDFGPWIYLIRSCGFSKEDLMQIKKEYNLSVTFVHNGVPEFELD